MAHRKQWTDDDKAQWQAQTEKRIARLRRMDLFLSELSAPCRNRWNVLASRQPL